MENNPIYLGNLGKDVYYFYIMSSVEGIDNLCLSKQSISLWRNYFSKNDSFETLGIFFIFSNEIFLLSLCKKNTYAFVVCDEKELFETLIDNRIEHRGDPQNLLQTLKLLCSHIKFHKQISSNDGYIYKTMDEWIE